MKGKFLGMSGGKLVLGLGYFTVMFNVICIRL